MSGGLLDQLDLILSRIPSNAMEAYDRAAPQYDQFREIWLKLAGHDAEGVMQEVLGTILAPGSRVLDAGCGTGAVSREIRSLYADARITMLDQSMAMLAEARGAPAGRVRADIGSLPFNGETFDVVTSAWVIETVPDPTRAVAEMLRVLSTSGYLLYSFCSLPNGWFSRAASVLLRKTVERSFAGKFLTPEETPWHSCERSRRWTFDGGLTTLVLLRKCCSVGPGVLPAPMEEVPPTVV